MATQTKGNAQLWVMDPADPMNADPLLDGYDVTVTVERTADIEIALHATADGDDCSTVSIYVRPEEALALAGDLMAAAHRKFSL